MKFPKQLYIRFEDPDKNGGYFCASKDIEGEHGDKVAIYELKIVKTLARKEELVSS